jgi:shikimate kinase
MSVFLVGLMGAGKSTVGRLLARELHFDFVDSDHEIEARTGVKIPVIFDVEGEAGFRKREAAIIDELTQRPNVVLGTGGGAVLLEENCQHLRERGTVVYLRTPLNELWYRVQHDRNRPLLHTPNPKQKLAELLKMRAPMYEAVADIIVESNGQSASHVVQKILAELHKLPQSSAISQPIQSIDSSQNTH